MKNIVLKLLPITIFPTFLLYLLTRSVMRHNDFITEKETLFSDYVKWEDILLIIGYHAIWFPLIFFFIDGYYDHRMIIFLSILVISWSVTRTIEYLNRNAIN